MIVTTDIADILYRDCNSFGIKRVPFGRKLVGELKEERITFHVKEQKDETYWNKCFCEVNICVPDLTQTDANTIRLKELERDAEEKFKSVTGTFDGTRYLYEKYTIHVEEDTALKCHFVNCKLLFNVLNTK